MKVRSARVTIKFRGYEPEKAPRTARHRAPRSTKLATAIVYPYVAEPIRVPASPSSWPFALKTPPASSKPQKLIQLRALVPKMQPADRTESRTVDGEADLHADAKRPTKAPSIRVPPPAGHTEPPLAPQLSAPDASDAQLASIVDAACNEPSAEVASAPQLENPPLPESVPPPADVQPAALTSAADGGEQPEPSLEERTSRARIVERLWEDPIREELEVNLGTTTESNLYVDMDLRVANGGVFVATYQDLTPGTRVSLHITLAGGLATSAHGRVTLRRESLEAFGDAAPGVCVAFELLSNEALALLEQFASIRTPWLIEDE